MTRPTSLVILLLLASLLFTPSYAQGPLLVEYAVVQSLRPPEKKVMDSKTWNEQLRSGRHRVLESGRAVGKINSDVLLMVGKKMPQVYTDPRAAGSQVQYTDLGFKIDYKVKAVDGGKFLLSVHIQQANPTGDPQNDRSSQVQTIETTVLLKRGQTAILGTQRGVLTAGYLGKSFPGVAFGEDSTVMLVVSLK